MEIKFRLRTQKTKKKSPKKKAKQNLYRTLMTKKRLKTNKKTPEGLLCDLVKICAPRTEGKQSVPAQRKMKVR